ncbi:MAG TPA: hypothetical protein VHD36_10660 [Pirellulales bacterium]|nr:hypothetical protein [Pirellulales bacterium]
MVVRRSATLVALCPPPASVLLWAFVETAELPVEPVAELDPATRATLLLALLAIIVLGVGLIVMVILGGRMVRRWARLTPPSRVPVRVPTPPPRELVIEFDDDDPDAPAGDANDARP